MAEKKVGDIRVKDSGEVYLIDNKEYPQSELTYDHYSSQYYPTNEYPFVDGIIDIVDNKFVTGTFIKSYDNIIIIDQEGNRKRVMSKQVLESQVDYLKDNKGEYRHKDQASPLTIYENFKISRDFKNKYPYGAGRDIEKYSDYFNKSDIKVTTGAKQLANLLNGLSVGLEFETSSGLINETESLRNGLIPLRDGSIEGLEYVTIPLEGEKGMQYLMNAMQILEERTSYDNKCALHYHFGNIPRTEEFIVALWILVTVLQQDLYRYQPIYKFDNRQYKSKNYSSPLPLLIRYFKPVLKGDDITSAYNHILNYLSMGTMNNTPLKDVTVHPADPHGTHKWNVKTRYAIVNFVPLIFGNHKTVEFRHHEITLNRNLVFSELLINAAIIRFAKENTKLILEQPENIPEKVSRLIESVYGNTSSSIYANILSVMDAKRHDLNRSFLEGKLFFDSKGYEYRNVVSFKLTEASVNKKLEIDFYKQYNSNIPSTEGGTWSQITRDQIARFVNIGNSGTIINNDTEQPVGRTGAVAMSTVSIGNRYSSVRRPEGEPDSVALFKNVGVSISRSGFYKLRRMLINAVFSRISANINNPEYRTELTTIQEVLLSNENLMVRAGVSSSSGIISGNILGLFVLLYQSNFDNLRNDFNTLLETVNIIEIVDRVTTDISADTNRSTVISDSVRQLQLNIVESTNNANITNYYNSLFNISSLFSERLLTDGLNISSDSFRCKVTDRNDPTFMITSSTSSLWFIQLFASFVLSKLRASNPELLDIEVNEFDPANTADNNRFITDVLNNEVFKHSSVLYNQLEPTPGVKYGIKTTIGTSANKMIMITNNEFPR